jgi:hypothetical protein
MEVTKYQKFNIERINRADINLAFYNPRKISEENKKKLKSIIKDKNIGLVETLVYNKQTKNLISGHQRISQIDELEGKQDYYLDLAVIDVPIEIEVKINVLLNQKSIQGEWDKETLGQIKETYPEIDFIKDLCFEKYDLEFMELKVIEEKPAGDYDKKTEQFEKYKKGFDQYKKNIREEEKKTGLSYSKPERSDYCLTIIFNNNTEKWEFMQNINQKETEKFIKYDDFLEFIKDDYRV